MIKANMIFAVRPQNIRTIPKVISLLGRMSVIVALSPKETPWQCSQYGEWSHKKENYAKKARCFLCNSDRHEASNHVYMEEECKDGSAVYPHPPKCIVCNGPHRADFDHCPLKPVFSKLQGSVKKPAGLNIVQVREQQKLIRDRVIRENRMTIETAAQVANPDTNIPVDHRSATKNPSSKH